MSEDRRPHGGATPPDIDGLEPVEVVGQGGAGTVWRCAQPQFNRSVAVKVVDHRVGEDDGARFARECQAMGTVSSHPHILPVYAGGVDGRGWPYLLMPYVEHGSLARPRRTLQQDVPPGRHGSEHQVELAAAADDTARDLIPPRRRRPRRCRGTWLAADRARSTCHASRPRSLGRPADPAPG